MLDKYNLVMHRYADTDAYASSVMFGEILKQFGKQVKIICLDSKSYFKRFYDNFKFKVYYIEDLEPDDYQVPTVFLDCRPFANNTTDLFTNVVGVVDHHNVSDFAELMHLDFVDIRPTGACVSITIEYFIEMNMKFFPQLATLAYMGISIDTRGFIHNMTDLDVKALNTILDFVDIEDLPRVSGGAQKKELLNTILKLDKKHNISDNCLFLDVGMGVVPASLASIAEFTLQFDNIDNAFIMSEYPKKGYIKFSMRTKKLRADKLACKISEKFSGDAGGKARESGGVIFTNTVVEFSFELIVSQLKDIIKEEIRLGEEIVK